MKTYYYFSLSLSILLFLSSTMSVFASTNPIDYTKLEWIGEPGITTYMKVPQRVGYIDYLTTVDLTAHEITLLSTTSQKIYEGPAVPPFDDDVTKNWLFTRTIVEQLKTANPEAKFIWNAPFFNTDMSSTVLSLGLKSKDEQGIYITSGVRPSNDIVEQRRMLIIDNDLGQAWISDFDAGTFVTKGDQAVEGFHPLGSPSNKAEYASRVFLGVRNDGKELVIFCSRNATKEEASNALQAAGVPIEHQIHVDGGGSATCGYNLPGQYFVEPGRGLPHIMGAVAKADRGVITIEGLNVRSGPGLGYAVVRKLSLNEEVRLFEQQAGWYRISETEWIYGGYVKKMMTYPYMAAVTIPRLNVRAGAGINFAVTRQVVADEVVTVHEEKDGWMRISETEWVSGEYIKEKE